MYVCHMKVKDPLKQQAIIEKTIDLVFEKGFAGVKMADLAKRVGISVSTLYVYHKNKEELIVSVYKELISIQTKQSEKNIPKDLPYKLKLKSLWLYWIDFSINHGKEMSYLNQIKQSPYYNLVPTEVKEIGYSVGFELFDLGKKEGLLKDVENHIIVTIFGTLLVATVKLILDKKLQLNEKDSDLMFSFLWDSIKS